MAPCLTLNIIKYESRVSGAILGKEYHPLLYLSVVAIEKGVFRSPSTMVRQQFMVVTLSLGGLGVDQNLFSIR